MIQPIRKVILAATLTCVGASLHRSDAQTPTHPADAKVYDFGGRTVIERGDTLKLVFAPGELANLVMKMHATQKVPAPRHIPPGLDTLVILLRPDSAFVVLSGKRFPMHPRLAEHFRNLRFYARRDAEHPIGSPIVVP